MRTLLLLIAFGMAVLTGCSPPPLPPPPAPTISPVLNLKQLMEWVLDPAADVIWDSVKTIYTQAGAKEIKPETDEQWAAVHSAAATLTESASMLMLEGRAKDQSGWTEAVRWLVAAAEKARKAAEAKNAQVIFEIGGEALRGVPRVPPEIRSPPPGIPGAVASRIMRTKALHDFCTWLESTPMSQTIQSVNWIVPAVQTLHILAIAAVMASVLMINLRLLGVLGRDQPLPRFSERFLPVIWWALPMLLVTGAIMVIGEPMRSLENAVFQLKMCLVLAAIAITLGFQAPLRRNPGFWDVTAGRRGTSLAVAVVSLAVWVSIVFAGRWIAYY